jgi:hypothetical protein
VGQPTVHLLEDTEVSERKMLARITDQFACWILAFGVAYILIYQYF